MKSSISAKIPTELYEEVQAAIRKRNTQVIQSVLLKVLFYYYVIKIKRILSLISYYSRRKRITKPAKGSKL